MFLRNRCLLVMMGALLTGACSTSFLGLAPMGDRKEYVRARDLYGEQKYPQAIEELTNYIYKAGNVKRREARAYRLLGNSYEQLGQLDKALETYLEALEFHPKNVPLLLAAAQLYQRTGLNDKSQQLYDRALQQNPQQLEALAGQAENYRTFGFYSKARTYYDQFFALDPNPPAQYRARYATTFLNQNNFEQAFIHITDALAQDPQQPDYWLVSAKAAFGLGYTDLALEHIETALDLAPQRTDLQLYKIMGMYQLGRYTQSLQAAQQLLQKQPQQPLALLLCALNEQQLGYRTRALKHLTQARNLADEKSFVRQVANKLLLAWK